MNHFVTYKKIFETNTNYNVASKSDRYSYDFAVEQAMSNNYKKIIDISSGRGLLIERLKEEIQDIDITSTDLEQFNDFDVKFIKLDLTDKSNFNQITETFDILFCLDVLEHIEEEYIEDILLFFKKLSDNFCFTIANHSDIIDGSELHLIQKDKVWWDDILSRHFDIVSSHKKNNDDRLYCYVLINKKITNDNNE